jgi:eukaryotic-like serine/threonine-protein kinase
MRDTHALETTTTDIGYGPGDLIAGKYRLGSGIREGGMCRVRMGVHTMLDLPVAIKYLRPTFRCPMLARSLLREARATAALRHPAIVRILDWGLISSDDGYIVMEQLEGEELRAHLSRQGALPPEYAIRLLLPICGGIAVAHSRRIVHRDLKPENVILALDDTGHVQPKVLDFGIANRAFEQRLREGSGAAAVGTLGYMPPEQAFGLGSVDHRTDVWAYCAMVYEALSGRMPVLGETIDELQRALVEDDIPSLAETIGIDDTLWAILERGLRREPNERWPAMYELGQELARWLLSRGVYDDVSGRSIISEWLRHWASTPFAPCLAGNDVSPPSGDTFVRATPLPFPLVKPKAKAVARRRAGYARARLDLLRSLQADAKRNPSR